MSERSIITSEVLDMWWKIREYFGLSKSIPLRIHWTPVYTVRSATGSAITPDYIKRSKRDTSPYVNITIPDSLKWFDSHKENVRKILTHEALHFRIPKHTPETRKYGYSHNIEKDTYTEEFMRKIQF